MRDPSLNLSHCGTRHHQLDHAIASGLVVGATEVAQMVWTRRLGCQLLTRIPCRRPTTSQNRSPTVGDPRWSSREWDFQYQTHRVPPLSVPRPHDWTSPAKNPQWTAIRLSNCLLSGIGSSDFWTNFNFPIFPLKHQSYHQSQQSEERMRGLEPRGDVQGRGQSRRESC
jgi:hypothetical protein